MSKLILKGMIPSKLVCSKCGYTTSVFRYKHKLRQNKHIKTMYCFKCKEETDFIENNYYKKLKEVG